MTWWMGCAQVFFPLSPPQEQDSYGLQVRAMQSIEMSRPQIDDATNLPAGFCNTYPSMVYCQLEAHSRVYEFYAACLQVGCPKLRSGVLGKVRSVDNCEATFIMS